jgi:hypothetical protein
MNSGARTNFVCSLPPGGRVGERVLGVKTIPPFAHRPSPLTPPPRGEGNTPNLSFDCGTAASC